MNKLLLSVFSYKLITVAIVTVISFISFAQFLTVLQATFIDMNMGPGFGLYIFGGVFVASTIAIYILMRPQPTPYQKPLLPVLENNPMLLGLDYKALIFQFSLGVIAGATEQAQESKYPVHENREAFKDL